MDAVEGPRCSVVVFVGDVDRRVLPALQLVRHLGARRARAVHVEYDPDHAARVVRDWFSLDLDWLPLEIAAPRHPTLARDLREILVEEAEHGMPVVALIPELDLQRPWRRVLHAGTSRTIARVLHGIRGVDVVVVPFAADLATR